MTTVHQFWDKVSPPPEVSAMMASWRGCSDFSAYHLWNDVSAHEFLGQNFDARVMAAYRQCAVPAMKADLFRYCVLYRSGGLYADADIHHESGLTKILEQAPRVMLFKRQLNIANDLLFFRNQSDPLLEVVIENAVSNIEQKVTNNVWETTGPGVMSSLFKSNPELFDEVTWVPIQTLKLSIRFNWKLSYKDSAEHWVSHQETKSIYVE